jgi:hypothetical protein
MIVSSNFTGWDFVGTWTMPSGQMPQLQLTTSSYRIASSDILLPANANLAPTGDFTYEMWIKYDVSQTYWAAFWDSTNFGFLARSGDTALKWRFFVTGATTLTSTSAANNATWTHVAYVRSGTSVKLYINGVVEASGTSDGSTINFASGDKGSAIAGWATIIGRAGPPYYQAGDNHTFCNVSVMTLAKTARYTANFTPLTRLTNDSNTVLYIVMPNSPATAAVVDIGQYALTLGSHNITRSSDSP